jgi:hypothetical protein
MASIRASHHFTTDSETREHETKMASISRAAVLPRAQQAAAPKENFHCDFLESNFPTSDCSSVIVGCHTSPVANFHVVFLHSTLKSLLWTPEVLSPKQPMLITQIENIA